MILMNVDTKPTYEAMKRGEWPEPNPEVVAAHKALNIVVESDPDAESSRKLAEPEDAPESSRRLA